MSLIYSEETLKNNKKKAFTGPPLGILEVEMLKCDDCICPPVERIAVSVLLSIIIRPCSDFFALLHVQPDSTEEC